MFAALDGAFGQHAARGGSDGESSDSDSEQGRAPAAAQQQRQPPSQAAAGAGDGDSSSSSSSGGSDSDSGDEGREGAAGRHVPRHLRWQPDLVLPGAGRQQQGAQAGSSAAAAAAAAAAAGAVSVHAVARGGKDSLHVPSVDARVQQKAARSAAPDTAGKGWFDLPATQITEEVKNDLRLLRLR
jgi:hypothetical protein